jgi:hypothetical protein
MRSRAIFGAPAAASHGARADQHDPPAPRTSSVLRSLEAWAARTAAERRTGAAEAWGVVGADQRRIPGSEKFGDLRGIRHIRARVGRCGNRYQEARKVERCRQGRGRGRLGGKGGEAEDNEGEEGGQRDENFSHGGVCSIVSLRVDPSRALPPSKGAHEEAKRSAARAGIPYRKRSASRHRGLLSWVMIQRNRPRRPWWAASGGLGGMRSETPSGTPAVNSRRS